MKLQVIQEEQSWIFKRNLDQLNLKRILRRLHQKFPKLPNQFILQYEDIDGDMIDVTCDEDLLTLGENIHQEKLITLYIQDVQNGGFKKQDIEKIPKKFQKQVMQMVANHIETLIPEITKKVQLEMETIELKNNLNKLTIETEYSDNFNEEQKIKLKEFEQIIYEKEIENKEKIIHEKVMCDNCDMFPIIGTRYKCAICKDFDLCEECEDKNNHDHPFLKIRTPQQAPSIIFAALGDKPDLQLGNEIREKLPQFIASLEQNMNQQNIEQENPIISELKNILNINQSTAQELITIFPGLTAQEIIEIVNEDQGFLNCLK